MSTSAADKNKSRYCSIPDRVSYVTRWSIVPRTSGPMIMPRATRIRTSGIRYLVKIRFPKNPMKMMEPIARNAVIVWASICLVL